MTLILLYLGCVLICTPPWLFILYLEYCKWGVVRGEVLAYILLSLVPFIGIVVGFAGIIITLIECCNILADKINSR